MIDIELAEAFVHRPHAVMLRKLKPLSLRRLFALLIIDSPFLDGNRDADWGDLEQAVTICALRDPVSALADLARHRTLRGRLLRRLRPAALQRHALKFVAYLKDYHSVPETTEDDGDGKLAKAPWILRIVETLRRNGYQKRWYHIWHDPAWDMATGEAFHIYSTLVELDGGELNQPDPREKELLAMARAASEERERKAAADKVMAAVKKAVDAEAQANG